MDVFLDNFYFIWINSFLALVAVLFGWLMNKANSTFAKAWTGFLWLLFLPNTIYILTDLTHLVEQWPRVDNLFKFILIIQYSLFSIFGVVTFLVSVYFSQKILQGTSKKGIGGATVLAICILNLIVGFGVVLGGIERTNSWHIITNPSKALEDILSLIYSKELLALSMGIGVFANVLYFLMAETVVKWDKKFFKGGL